ncbi:MAG: DNA segregation ATPase FtsK/SpoIIIE, S-DNA-T family [Parcubacteria group bacterium Gr01-1014_31]|nr:MAG: DNA segregation ATPase FtsK/SpoIIIE, S-DNA-T family [Parcubacteria group bacterium Gr01-1014_31]
MFRGRRRAKHKEYRSSRSAYDRYYRADSARRRRTLRQKFADIPVHTKRGIASVVILGVSLSLLLALLGLAGPASVSLTKWLRSLMGAMRWLLPGCLLVLGYLLARPDTEGWLPLRWLGAFLLFSGMSGIAHLPQASGTFAEAKFGRGGGMLGYAVSHWLTSASGVWVSLVVLLVVVTIGVFLFFNTSFAHLAAAMTWLQGTFAALRQHLIRRRVKQLQAEREQPALPVPVETSSIFHPQKVPAPEAADEDEERDNEETLPAPVEGDGVLAAAVKKPRRRAPRKLDLPLSLLTGQAGKPTSGDIKANQYLIEKTLKNFGIEAEMGEVSVGPTVTQYTLKPADGVKLSKIVSLSDNLALALAAHPIRIEAPIPGRSLVGIEVPNQTTAIVPLRQALDSDEFRQRRSNLMVALGMDVKGKPWLADLSRMPHLLIAGATGSGKSVCINTIIVSLLYQNSPDDLHFVMVDPKRVELPIYNGIPHLVAPVITDVKKTINALHWAIREMEHRFDTLAAVHKRDIASYNETAEEKMPYIVLVIDELADLMVAAGPDIEGSIIRLAQMSRAVGIHLVIATQRPSVDVITGLIKANITTRIAFSVASLVDSRTILDMSGAEKLLGRGDMLFLSAEISKPKRLQGAYAADGEIKRVIDHLKQQGLPEYDPEVTEPPSGGSGVIFGGGRNGGGDDDGDSMLEAATDVILRYHKASASMLQRRLRIGYSRAARILDLLQERGVVGPADGSKAREVLLRRDPGDATIAHEEPSDTDDVAEDDDAADVPPA